MMSLDELRAVRDTALPDYYDRKANRKLLRIYMNALSNAIEQIEGLRNCLFPDVTKAGHYAAKTINVGLYDALRTGGNDE
jgi:hypothetical protein